MSVSIESRYATSCLWLILTYIISRTVSKLSHIILQNFGHFAFFSPFGGLGQRKLVVNFLYVLTELFSLAVTAEY